MLTTLVLVGVPVKPFASAKQRLAAALTPEARIALSREMARLTCGLVVAAGARPLVLAADREVEQWAMEQSIEVTFDAGSNLDRAARSAVDAAAGRPWMILHADLPFLNEEALSIVVELVAGGQSAIAPSRDGGTPLIAASLDAFE
ncbi:MAG: NTP transferase domain-containing protein, partial [Acidimicrobiia bacterium]